MHPFMDNIARPHQVRERTEFSAWAFGRRQDPKPRNHSSRTESTLRWGKLREDSGVYHVQKVRLRRPELHLARGCRALRLEDGKNLLREDIHAKIAQDAAGGEAKFGGGEAPSRRLCS